MSSRHQEDSPRRIAWWALLALLIFMGLIVRAVVSQVAPEPVAIAAPVVIAVVIAILMRDRIRWQPARAVPRDEEQITAERSRWAIMNRHRFSPEQAPVKPALGRLAILAEAEVTSSRLQVNGVYQQRNFSLQTWQVQRPAKPHRSRTAGPLMRHEIYEVIVVDTEVMLPPVWVWGSQRKIPYLMDFPLTGHGRNPLHFFRVPPTVAATLPATWESLEPVVAPLMQRIQDAPILLAAAGGHATISWRDDATIPTTETYLELVESFASALEQAVGQGVIPRGRPDPISTRRW